MKSLEVFQQVTNTDKPIKRSDIVNKVSDGDDLIGKYSLVPVDITDNDKEILKKANDFVNFFKLRLFQFLIRRNRHSKISYMPHAIAGGFLSDSYMREHAAVTDTSACRANDIDVFMQVPTEVFKGLDIETFTRELKQEIVTLCDRNYSHINITKYERANCYDFISVPYIFKIEIPGLPKLEIVLSESLERIFDFDISIRHFFNFYGQEEVYAAPIAIQDIQERQLTVVCPLTPKSTLARLFYFQKRYGFTIVEHSYSILAWVFAQKQNTVHEVYQYVIELEKFKNNVSMKAYIFTCVLDFCKKFKLEEMYLAGFRVEFPYHEMFEPIYDHISTQSLHDIIFTKTFPYGFIGRFSNYIFSDNGEDILTHHSKEYSDAIENCKLGWASDLYERYTIEPIEVHDDVKEYVELDRLYELQSIVERMSLPNEFIQKYFSANFIEEQLHPRPLIVTLPPYARSFDVPEFLKELQQNAVVGELTLPF